MQDETPWNPQKCPKYVALSLANWIKTEEASARNKRQSVNKILLLMN